MAIPPPVHLTLRDGGPCVLRPAVRDDAARLIELELAIVRAGSGMVKQEDEMPTDLEDYANHVGLGREGRVFCLVAEREGVLLAEASIARIGLRMLRHVGTLGIGVHPAYQGLGLGRALLQHVMAWVREHRDEDGGRVLRVELGVRSDNPRAVALYRSLGFVEEGVRRDFVRLGDGSFVDDITMGQLFERPR
jgi:putative acetyltransferase